MFFNLCICKCVDYQLNEVYESASKLFVFFVENALKKLNQKYLSSLIDRINKFRSGSVSEIA